MKNPGFTEREKEVFSLIAAGYTRKQSAEKLGISEKTVSVHRNNIRMKLELDGLSQLHVLAGKPNLQPIHELLEAAQELMDILKWMPKGPHHNAMIRLDKAIAKATEENSTKTRHENP